MYEAIDALFKSEPYVYPHTYLNGHMIMEALMLDLTTRGWSETSVKVKINTSLIILD